MENITAHDLTEALRINGLSVNDVNDVLKDIEIIQGLSENQSYLRARDLVKEKHIGDHIDYVGDDNESFSGVITDLDPASRDNLWNAVVVVDGRMRQLRDARVVVTNFKEVGRPRRFEKITDLRYS